MDLPFIANKKKIYMKIPILAMGNIKLKVLVFPSLPNSTQPSKPYTNYIDRYVYIDVPYQKGNTPYTHQGVILLKMPLTSERITIRIYREEVGNTPNDKSFFIPSQPVFNKLEQKWDIVYKYFDKDKIKEFVEFAEEFSENAGILSADSVYRSDNGKYRIDYLPNIKTESGKTLGTPSRIETKTGIIEANKSQIIKYSVPCRVALLLHEYCHIYRNKNRSLIKEYSHIFHKSILDNLTSYDIEEMESDLNALVVFLSLNYPTSDAKKWFLNFAINYRTEQNEKRDYMMECFIDEFIKKYEIV